MLTNIGHVFKTEFDFNAKHFQFTETNFPTRALNLIDYT